MTLQRNSITPGKSRSIDHFYLCNYVASSYGSDDLSRSLLRFKSNMQFDLQAWVECSVAELSKIVHDQFIVVRALHGQETSPVRSSLDSLGNKLMEVLHCRYEPALIAKTRATRALKFLDKTQRSIEMKSVYEFTGTAEFNHNSFLIIDDILTTGTTMTSIAEAITTATGNSNILFYTLALSERISSLNKDLKMNSNVYGWEPTKGWIVAEEDENYGNLNNLKRLIESDFGNSRSQSIRKRR